MSTGITPFGTSITADFYTDESVYSVMTDIHAKQIIATPDVNHGPQNLYVAATSSLYLQSQDDLHVDIAPNSAFNIYQASGNYNNDLTETPVFSLSAANNITNMSVGENILSLIPGDRSVTTNVGSMIVNENISSQLVDTTKFDIKILKDLTVLGNLTNTGTFYSPYLNAVNLVIDNNFTTTNHVTTGNNYGNNMNIWIDTATDSNDNEKNRIGYGFQINSNTEQLELFKYKRYSFVDSNGDLQTNGKTQYRKVAQFGYGVTSYDKDSDKFDTSVFDSLDFVKTSSNLYINNSGGSNMGTAGTVYWVLNSNANIYYYGNIGINQTNPQYAIDVNGSINVSDTVISLNYVTASDERIKTDINRLNNAVCLDTIKHLEPCSYHNEVLKTKKTGFIAQEIKKIIPECVQVKNNPTLEINDFHYIDYSSIIGYLVGAIKELDEKVEHVMSAQKNQFSSKVPAA